MKEQDISLLLHRLRLQLRITQAIGGLAIMVVGYLWMQTNRSSAAVDGLPQLGRSPSGGAVVSALGGQAILDGGELQLTSVANTAAELRATTGNAALALSSVTTGMVLVVDRESDLATLRARGDLRVELRFNTRTGEVAIVQTVIAGGQATERVTSLVPPIRG